MTIVDSSVWVDYLAQRLTPETTWLRREFNRGSTALTDLVLCEVLQGIREQKIFDAVRLDLQTLPILDAAGPDIAVASARNYRFLRSRGITVRKTIDCLIATFCIERDHSLLHRDRDFDPFEQHLGLKVIHASTSPAPPQRV